MLWATLSGHSHKNNTPVGNACVSVYKKAIHKINVYSSGPVQIDAHILLVVTVCLSVLLEMNTVDSSCVKGHHGPLLQLFSVYDSGLSK